MLNSELTLVISSCDKFSDLWEMNLTFLQKNWGDRGVRTILLTDKPTSFCREGVEVFSAGEGLEYPARMKALLPQITTEYVLITLDDYFLIRPVENERIERLISVMDREKLDYIRMFADPDSRVRYREYNGLYEIDLQENYAVNLYQSIWRKGFLQAASEDSVPIWQYEVTLSGIAKDVGAACVLSKGKEFEILDVIRKGMILHKAKRYLKKNGLALPDRKTIPYRTELRLALFDCGRKLLPKPLAKGVKKGLRKVGVRFISDYGSAEDSLERK